ncbi:MAG: hypothetical protein NT031_17225, partial [Planctomycetota bacterium]|nr:hypothetical protein [Planctomycetota bacterium]
IFVDGGCHRAGPGEWHLDDYINKMQRLAAIAPKAWLVMRFWLNVPGWWLAQNPDECIRHFDGLAPDRDASMGSQKWIADLSEFLKAVVVAAERSPAGQRVLGYSLMCGHGGEWIYPGAGGGRLGDYSRPAVEYWRRWLGNKYGSQAWIDTAPIPSPQERGRSLPGLLRDPQLDQRVIDFDEAFSEMIADNILALARMIKGVTGGRRLVGVFYGYLLWQTGLVNALANNGHLAFRKLLESPEVDFFTSFPSYDVREPGAGAPILHPVESIQAAGKLVFSECDNRTHLTKSAVPMRFHMVRESRDGANGPSLSNWVNLHPLESAAISVSVLRREFVHHLIRGSAYWWFDQSGGWFSCDEIRADFRRQSQIARQALEWDCSSISQVAGIVSQQSPLYHSLMRMYDVDPQPSLLDLQADMSTREMYKAGAPVDWLMSEDLARPQMRQYRVLYLHNATFLSDSQRSALDALKYDGRTILSVGYPGLVAGGRLDERAASQAAGMRLRLSDTRGAGRFAPSDYNLPCLREATAQAVLGTGAILSPRLIVDDPDAQIIARWPDGEPAAAVREHPGWRAYYFPSPPNNAQILRAIFRQAGCHIYNAGLCRDVIYANKSLLAVHTNHYFQPLTLPAPARVTDLFSDTVVVEHGTQIPTGRSWHFGGGTNLYRVEYDR